MKETELQLDPSQLADQALHYIDKLSEIVDQLVDSTKPDESLLLKRDQLADLTKMIKQWEAKSLSVSPELTMMQLGLSSEITAMTEKANYVEKVRVAFQELSSKFPIVGRPGKVHVKPTNGSLKHLDGSRTDSQIYKKLIVEVLRQFGGKATSIQVMKEIEMRLNGVFTEWDRQIKRNGESSWAASVRDQRKQLLKEGIIKKVSPTGLWELEI